MQHGFETRTGPYGPTGKTVTLSVLRFFFNFKNRSMGKEQEPARTMVGLYGSKNHDWFLRFGRFLFSGKVSANTSAVLWVFSDLEPNERENNKNKKTEKKKQRKKKTTKKKEKSKNEEITPHSKQPSSCEPKHVTNFQRTNPSIFTLLLCFVLTSRC